MPWTKPVRNEMMTLLYVPESTTSHRVPSFLLQIRRGRRRNWRFFLKGMSIIYGTEKCGLN